jgi:hypothetical protein
MRLLAAFAVSVAAVVAGCSGGGASAESMSREEFVAKANEICRDSRRDAQYPRNPSGSEEFAEALDSAAAALRDLISRLRDLPVPPELAGDVEAWLANDDLAAHLLEEAADAVRKDSSVAAALGVTPVLNDATKESERLARKIGATACVGPD